MFANLSVQEVTLLVVLFLAGMAFISALISLWLEPDRSRQWWGDWFQGVSTEMVGAVVTALLFTFIVGAVEQEQARQALKEDLIKRMSSSVNSEAVRATEELRAEGWLRDGTLRGEEFAGANLAGAQLIFADLREAILFDVILDGAILDDALLDSVNLQAASLRATSIQRANLRNANLIVADLAEANLTDTDLRGANLFQANLENAILDNILFDTNTVLPDSIYNSANGDYNNRWTPQTDMARYTNPDHPNFWRPSVDEFGLYPEWYKP